MMTGLVLKAFSLCIHWFNTRLDYIMTLIKVRLAVYSSPAWYQSTVMAWPLIFNTNKGFIQTSYLLAVCMADGRDTMRSEIFPALTFSINMPHVSQSWSLLPADVSDADLNTNHNMMVKVLDVPSQCSAIVVKVNAKCICGILDASWTLIFTNTSVHTSCVLFKVIAPKDFQFPNTCKSHSCFSG